MQLGFLHYSLIRGPLFFQSKGSNQFTCIQNTLYKIWVFFFFNTPYPFLKTVDFLHTKSGLLQNLYKMVDDLSFRYDGFFFLLDLISTNTGSRSIQHIKVKSMMS